jgi:hypothetical protein
VSLATPWAVLIWLMQTEMAFVTAMKSLDAKTPTLAITMQQQRTRMDLAFLRMPIARYATAWAEPLLKMPMEMAFVTVMKSVDVKMQQHAISTLLQQTTMGHASLRMATVKCAMAMVESLYKTLTATGYAMEMKCKAAWFHSHATSMHRPRTMMDLASLPWNPVKFVKVVALRSWTPMVMGFATATRLLAVRMTAPAIMMTQRQTTMEAAPILLLDMIAMATASVILTMMAFVMSLK